MAGRTPTSVTAVSRNALTAFPAPSVAGDVTNGNVSPNDGATFLAVLNSDAVATHVLTVQVVSGVDGLTAGPRPYTVPVSASGTQLAGPFPIQFYGSQLLWNVDSAQLKVAPYSVLGP
jgi:hypothetical protein